MGMVTTPAKVYQGVDRASHSIWTDHWADTVVGKTFSNHESIYGTGDPFVNQPDTTVDTLANQHAGDAVSDEVRWLSYVTGVIQQSIVLIDVDQCAARYMYTTSSPAS